MSSRTCAKPGCNTSASATLTYDYASRTAWVEHLNDEAHPMRYDLCSDHADALTVPRGWALQDRRVRYPSAGVLAVRALPDFRGARRPAYPAPVNEVATAPVPAPPKVQRWGIPDALVGWLVVYLFANVWFIAVVAATGHVGDEIDDLPLGVVALAQLGLSGGFFVVPWVVTKVKGNGLVADLGVRARWEDLWKGGLAGILTQLLLLPLLYVPIFWLFDKGSDDLEGPAQELTDRANGPLDVVLLVLIVGVMAAVFEEIFFRGLMQRAFLKRSLHPVLAIGITSVFFGATHFQCCSSRARGGRSGVRHAGVPRQPPGTGHRGAPDLQHGHRHRPPGHLTSMGRTRVRR